MRQTAYNKVLIGWCLSLIRSINIIDIKHVPRMLIHNSTLKHLCSYFLYIFFGLKSLLLR